MGSYYSVVRYLPNPLSEEFLNFGVLTFEGDRVRAYFLKDWDRLRRFGGGRDIGFVRGFAQRLERATKAAADGDKLNETEVRRLAEGFKHSIQLTPPAGSVLGVDALLEDCIRVYLPRPTAAKPKPRSRSAAFSVVSDALSDALQAKGGDEALDHLQTHHSLAGRHWPYKFAAVLSNGAPRAAVDAFSFEIQVNEHLLKNIRAAAYSHEDVRKANPGLSVTVMMLEPPLAVPEYETAVSILRDVGSRVVAENEVYEWAEEAAELVLAGH
jgi:hypothetical protein